MSVLCLVKAKVRELEEKCRTQSEQFNLLSRELEKFRQQAGKIDLLSSNSVASSDISGSPGKSLSQLMNGIATSIGKGKDQPFICRYLFCLVSFKMHLGDINRVWIYKWRKEFTPVPALWLMLISEHLLSLHWGCSNFIWALPWAVLSNCCWVYWWETCVKMMHSLCKYLLLPEEESCFKTSIKKNWKNESVLTFFISSS